MATYSGTGGLLVLGGVLDGTPLLNGALTTAVATLALDGTGLKGVVLTGDVFQIAAGVNRTVTGGPYVVANASCTSITFTPAATATLADDSALTFNSNTVAQVRRWSLRATVAPLDSTTMGNVWRTTVGGEASYSGDAEALLDYGDANQAELVAKCMVTTPTVTAAALTFRVATSKQFYGNVLLSNLRIVEDRGQLVTVAFSFMGSGAIVPNWG